MDMQLDIEEHTATGAWPSFTIKVADFHKAVSVVKGAVERTTLVPILTHVLIEARDGRLRLTCTDMEISLTKTIEANIRVPGVMAVPAVLLADTLSRMQQDGVADVVAGEHSVAVKAGRSKVSFTTLDPADYPAFSAGPLQCKFDVMASALENAISRVAMCVSVDTTRTYLNGIYTYMSDPAVLCMCATDGVTLAEVTIPLPAEVERLPSIIIPTKAIGQIKSCLSSDVALVSMEASDTRARFTFGDTVLTTKLIDGAYPEYKRVIPAKTDAPAIISTAALKQSVRLAANIVEDKNNGVIFDLEDGLLKISSSVSERGSANSELGAGDVNYDGAPIAVGFNGNKMHDALSAMTGDAEIHIRDASSPILMLDTKDGNYLYVLMTLRF